MTDVHGRGQVGAGVGAPVGGPATVEHLLALKVMRLTRPTMATPLLVPVEDSAGDALLRGSLQSQQAADPSALKGLSDLALGQALVLPQSFGSIYLGETFSSYISLHNDSTEACTAVTMRCDLQTATQRIPLHSTPPSDVEFPPGGSVDKVLNHEVKELGAHILVCEVTYSTPRREKLSFRKFFKFQVMKPLDVKTKFYNAESDEVFLEAQVQNVTLGPLCLEKVNLDPSQFFEVTPLNDIEVENGQGKRESVFGRVNCIQPQDARQYLFRLTPKPEVKVNYKLLKGITNIGKLDIVWRTNMGDRGRLQTSQLQRMAPGHGDVRLTITGIPSLVLLGKTFTIKARLINYCERTLDLELNLLNVHQPRLTWSGVTATKLGLLEASGHVDVEMQAVPHESGLQVISGVRVTDVLLKRTYDFDDLCQVYVCDDEELASAITL